MYCISHYLSCNKNLLYIKASINRFKPTTTAALDPNSIYLYTSQGLLYISSQWASSSNIQLENINTIKKPQARWCTWGFAARPVLVKRLSRCHPWDRACAHPVRLYFLGLYCCPCTGLWCASCATALGFHVPSVALIFIMADLKYFAPLWVWRSSQNWTLACK